MRHGKKFNHLSRKTGHRKAMLSNMASSLIKHKRITTTVAKAKALRVYVEPLMTKSKNDTVHSRRTVFSYLQDKLATKELFDEVSAKIAERPGGYTRILRTTSRLGDGADLCIIELVDYNEDYVTTDTKSKTRKRRTRRGGKSGEETGATQKPASKQTKETAEEEIKDEAAVQQDVEETKAAGETVTQPEETQKAPEEKPEAEEKTQAEKPKAETKEAPAEEPKAKEAAPEKSEQKTAPEAKESPAKEDKKEEPKKEEEKKPEAKAEDPEQAKSDEKKKEDEAGSDDKKDEEKKS